MKENNSINKQLPYILITLAVFIGFAGPFLVGEGMFMDGLLYSIISNNLAHHSGSFWNPHLTETFYPEFREHPPLAFAMQSVFYHLFGDNIFIDKVYSLFTIIITGLIIVLIWKNTVEKKFLSYLWVPLFFWSIIPIVTWSAVNNMLENTMMIFTSLSVFFILKSYEKRRVLFLVLSGFSVFLGFFSKGFVALFPLSGVFWFWLLTRKTGFFRCFIDSIILISATILPFILLFLFSPDGIEYLNAYFQKQVVGSLKSVKTVDSRFFILWFLFQQIIPVLLIMFSLIFIAKKKKIKIERSEQIPRLKYAIALIALSGIVPMMVSLKQRGFYITTTLPLFVIAFALYITPFLHPILSKYTDKTKTNSRLKLIGFFLLACSVIVSFTFINKPIREKNLLNDVKKMIAVVPKSKTISGETSLYSNWSLHGYLKRYAGINLHKGFEDRYDFFLTNKNSTANIPNNFKEEDILLTGFRLYKKYK